MVAATASTPAVAETGTFKNVITIEPGTGFNGIKYYDDFGTASATQPLANPTGRDKSCYLTENGSGANGILKLSAKYAGVDEGNYVGLVAGKGSLGVAETKSGTSCAQVAEGTAESITLELGLANPGLVAVGAMLDIEVQKDAQITAVASGAGETRTFRFLSGRAYDGVETSTISGCAAGSTSSGSNNDTSDNCRWYIQGVKFTKLVLTADAGQFSIEGGYDGLLPDGPPADSFLPQRASYIQLQDGLLCGESTFTLPASGAAPQVTVRRLNNADSTQTCTGFTYELTNAGAQVNFIKPFDTQTSVQFVMELVWPITYAQADLPPVKFSFHNSAGQLSTTTDANGNTVPVTRNLSWCPSPTIVNGLVTGLTPNPLTNSDIPDMETGTGFPGKQFACVAPTTLILDANNNPTGWSQPIYILGDAYARR